MSVARPANRNVRSVIGSTVSIRSHSCAVTAPAMTTTMMNDTIALLMSTSFRGNCAARQAYTPTTSACAINRERRAVARSRPPMRRALRGSCRPRQPAPSGRCRATRLHAGDRRAGRIRPGRERQPFQAPYRLRQSRRPSLVHRPPSATGRRLQRAPFSRFVCGSGFWLWQLRFPLESSWLLQLLPVRTSLRLTFATRFFAPSGPAAALGLRGGLRTGAPLAEVGGLLASRADQRERVGDHRASESPRQPGFERREVGAGGEVSHHGAWNRRYRS